MDAKIGSSFSQTTVVTTSFDMARILFKASASGAAAYALAAHEQACEAGDDQRIEFWHDVCRDLNTLRDRLDAQPDLNVCRDNPVPAACAGPTPSASRRSNRSSWPAIRPTERPCDQTSLQSG